MGTDTHWFMMRYKPMILTMPFKRACSTLHESKCISSGAEIKFQLRQLCSPPRNSSTVSVRYAVLLFPACSAVSLCAVTRLLHCVLLHTQFIVCKMGHYEHDGSKASVAA